MPATRYTTRDQTEMLDLICFKHYGRQVQSLERVLEANPGNAILRTHSILPAGTVIILPDLSAEIMEAKTQKLWD